MEDNYIDIYEKLKLNLLIYTKECIPINELSEEFNRDILGCDCAACSSSTCNCLSKNGPFYKSRKLLKLNTQQAIYECNSNCECSESCDNKLVSLGPHKALYVKKVINKGFGLFSNVFIISGSFICEYAGEIVTSEEAAKRHKFYKDNNNGNYIFWLKEHFGDREIVTIVDPTIIGNIGRFINHSCEPNCCIVPVRVDSIFPKLCVFAVKDICDQEEITFDYGCSEIGYVQGDNKKTVCFCGTASCKNYLPFHNV